jgi:hypothetical protein
MLRSLSPLPKLLLLLRRPRISPHGGEPLLPRLISLAHALVSWNLHAFPGNTVTMVQRNS